MQYLPKSDVVKLLRVIHTKNPVHHVAALIGFFCGARISQVLNVRGEDIFLRDDKWVIKIRAAKRGNAAIHTIHVDADPALDMTPVVALAQTKGQSRILGGLTRQYMNRCLKRYCEIAGIHSDFAHSHCLRHSAAIYVFDQTQRIGAVSQFLAHKSASAAFVYLRENDGIMAQTAMDNFAVA